MVIIAVPSDGNGGLKEYMNSRFGRCPSFTFVHIEGKKIVEVKAVSNTAVGQMGGAGIHAAQLIGNNGAEAVIIGFLGPNAAQSLNALNIPIYQAPNQQMTVREVIDLYIEDKLPLISNANVSAHQGMGGGRGMGMGGGRGMGSGQGMGRRPMQ
jgi:predicted Fe-Mo cluster-binding NifX family protein